MLLMAAVQQRWLLVWCGVVIMPLLVLQMSVLVLVEQHPAGKLSSLSSEAAGSFCRGLGCNSSWLPPMILGPIEAKRSFSVSEPYQSRNEDDDDRDEDSNRQNGNQQLTYPERSDSPSPKLDASSPPDQQMNVQQGSSDEIATTDAQRSQESNNSDRPLPTTTYKKTHPLSSLAEGEEDKRVLPTTGAAPKARKNKDSDSDLTLYQNTPTHLLRKPFPRWNETTGIDFAALMKFTKGVLAQNATVVNWKKLRDLFPETLYVVQHNGIWTSRAIRERTWKYMIRGRLMPTENIMKLALQILRSSTAAVTAKDENDGDDQSGDDQTVSEPSSEDRWPRLRHVVLNGPGFFFLVWYGDYRSCNFLNWNRQHSIPIFTTCGMLPCTYAFPLPTYKTIELSLEKSEEWDTVMNDYHAMYPWRNKTRQVVWRGSLTGPLDSYRNPRWRLCSLVNALSKDSPVRYMFNVGLTQIPTRHDHLDLDLTPVGGLVPGLFPMSTFQQYRAILDLDGNSWSSRFGALLCYSSVIIKVDPLYVDYFHLRDLVPWKHYIPVKYDLSDLVERVRWVLDPANDLAAQEIVANANQWCRTRMVYSSIAQDYLDIWESYVNYLHLGYNYSASLDLGSLHWKRVWRMERERMFAAKSKFAMTKL